jgi:hypothetical protein
MPVTVKAAEPFPENGVRGVQAAFTDADGSSVAPSVVAWTLTNDPGIPGVAPDVINDREAVEITPAATVVIVLSGEDLALLAGEVSQSEARRILLVGFTFDSAVLGAGVTDYVQYKFNIENIPYLT